MFRRLSLPAGLALLLLAGCTTPPGATMPPAPARAPALPPPPPASIRGSQESSTLLDNFTAFVGTVDGQVVPAGRAGWDQPLSLTPGRHRLGVEFVRGTFFARTELTLEAKPGAAYELRYATDAQVYGAHSYCEFWIVDLASGEKVTPPVRTELGKVKAGG